MRRNEGAKGVNMTSDDVKKRYLNHLNKLEIENGEITEIKFLEATKSPLSFEGMAMNDIPARCEVYATLKPTKNSDIKIVVGLPLENWNNRFLGTGNGGGAGSLVMQDVNAGVARYFATANTDMGTAPWDKCVNNPDRWEDFGHRATHLMTKVGKQITEAFYGKKIKHSYFKGGSTGGCQALQEAQRYPEDYDGIVAFCPAYNRVNLHQAFIWDWHVMCSDPASRFTPEQILAVKNRVIELFAEKSGSAKGDEFLSYPGKIDFKPDDVFTVFDGLGLTERQLETLKNVYSFPKNPQTGKEIYVPQPLGCEAQVLGLSYIEDGFIGMLGFLQSWVFGNDYDYKKYDFEKDYLTMVERLRDKCDATNPDLTPFKSHGGKLILITGTADCLIPYTDGKAYYESAVQTNGGLEKTTEFFRYFHIPGLGHCSGGPGLQEVGNLLGLPCIPCDKEHDTLEALIAWVERGEAPETLLPVALKNSTEATAVGFDKNVPTPIINGGREIDYERPVYPYPYETEYIGGDRKDKNSFRKKLGDGKY